jgi:thiamine pyrophosphokinase
MENKCLIITGGDEVKEELIIKHAKESQYIICADKGGETAYKYSIKPDVLLGDFDSIDKKILKDISDKIFEYPEEKDFTDTELALDYAIKKGFKNITLLNVTGDRIDHVLSTFLLLYKYEKYNIKIVGNNFEAFILKENCEIHNRNGDTLSIIPVGSMIEEIYLEGFKYPLNGAFVNVGDSLCVSNLIIEDLARIRFKKGKGLVIITNLEE